MRKYLFVLLLISLLFAASAQNIQGSLCQLQATIKSLLATTSFFCCLPGLLIGAISLYFLFVKKIEGDKRNLSIMGIILAILCLLPAVIYVLLPLSMGMLFGSEPIVCPVY
jgi:hypothetical protein